jgi:alkanesulfonate monooxygenase SsuD/methylene tetrahydromethanopterin reductase-like flavin-dependent oxidoreductase (luciferase family)
MRSGTLLTFQNLRPDVHDHENFKLELEMGLRAEDLGYDTLWAVEHHFDDYAMVPDNFTLLAYLAARTSSITIATGAAILPWNDPLRVAEKAIMLDYLTDGRFVLGIGRGLARMEYEGFGIPMDEARGRFDQSAEIILNALETGKMQADTEFYQQAEVTLRPAPIRSFKDRVYAVGISPESVVSAANLGAGLMQFVQMSIAGHAEAILGHKKAFEEKFNKPAPIPVLAQQMYCHPDSEVAADRARRYIGQYLHSVVKHYDFAGEHFDKIKGYQSYGEGARRFRDEGVDKVVNDFVDLQLWGTPDEILEKLRATKSMVGDFETNVVAAYAEMDPADLLASHELFAKEVIPNLSSL